MSAERPDPSAAASIRGKAQRLRGSNWKIARAMTKTPSPFPKDWLVSNSAADHSRPVGVFGPERHSRVDREADGGGQDEEQRQPKPQRPNSLGSQGSAELASAVRSSSACLGIALAKWMVSLDARSEGVDCRRSGRRVQISYPTRVAFRSAKERFFRGAKGDTTSLHCFRADSWLRCKPFAKFVGPVQERGRKCLRGGAELPHPSDRATSAGQVPDGRENVRPNSLGKSPPFSSRFHRIAPPRWFRSLSLVQSL